MTFSQLKDMCFSFVGLLGFFSLGFVFSPFLFAKSTCIDNYTKNTQIVVLHHLLTLGTLMLCHNSGLYFPCISSAPFSSF